MRKNLFSFLIFFSILFSLNETFAGWNPTPYTVATTASNNPQYMAPSLAFNQSGYVVAVWGHYNTFFIPARCYQQAAISTDFGEHWFPAADIDQASYQTNNKNTRPRVAVNDNNDALMTWHRYDSTLLPAGFDVRVCSLTNTPLGPTAQNLKTLDTNAGTSPSRPEIAMIGNTAIVVWSHDTAGANYFVYTSTTTDSGTNWPLSATPISMGGLAASVAEPFPQLYFDATGLAVVVWQYSSDGSTFYALQSVSIDSGVTWSTASILSGPSNDWTLPVVGGDGNGNVIAAWEEEIGPWPAPYDIKSSNYSTASGWSTPQTIDTGINDWPYPRITVNNNNQAIVTYQSADAGFTQYLVKTAFSSNGGQLWDVPVFVDPLNPNVNWKTCPEISMDNYGVALCVWNVENTSPNWIIKGAVSTDYGSNWSITTLSPNAIVNSAGIPRVKSYILDSGNHNAVNGIAIWPHEDPGSFPFIPAFGVVEMNHFKEITLKATGEQQKIKDFLQEELQNVITADAIGEHGTFKLYKDAALTQLIDTKSNSHRVATFIENNLKRGESFTYYVTWTDQFGKTVGPVIVRVDG